jgi:transcriptional antiterminator NusG
MEWNEENKESEESLQAEVQAPVEVVEEVEASSKEENTAVTEETLAAIKRVPSTREDLKWYIVHTHTGFEARAKFGLDEAIVRQKKEDEFGEILIPVESVVELVKGKKKSTERKFFPGYILVQMLLNDENWHLVKQTHRVTGFVGNARKPPAIPKKEVERITAQMVAGLQQAKPKYTFKEGDNVRVIDGPFANFNGTVEEVKPEKSKLRVLVSIFGRATPVELDFIQVEKT